MTLGGDQAGGADENVVYLPPHSVPPAGHGRSDAGPVPGSGLPPGTVPPNRRASEYDGVEVPDASRRPDPTSAHRGAGSAPIQLHPPAPTQLPVARTQQVDPEVAAALPAFGSHGPVPQPHELQPPPVVDDNPFGDFFSDGPSAWLEDDDPRPDGVRRLAGTAIATGAIASLLASLGVWTAGLLRGAGGAESGGFLLIAMLLWIWYLSLPRAQQHRRLLRLHQRMHGVVDRRVARLRTRTEGQLVVRRERDRYRSMRDERTRRVAALGEGSYRAFRRGALPPELAAAAQRVLAIERQMLMQDQRLLTLVEGEVAPDEDAPIGAPHQPGGATAHHSVDPAELRNDPAARPPSGGHPDP